MENKKFYRPLPDCLTIKTSEIDGLGLFAKEHIPAKTNLGITHIKDKRFQDGYIRTPLGGFFNHTDLNPNCKVIYKQNFIFLYSICEIKAGEEILVKYTLYNPKN